MVRVSCDGHGQIWREDESPAVDAFSWRGWWDILVGTPGRLWDHKSVQISKVSEKDGCPRGRVQSEAHWHLAES